jgi:hypothetical protein
MSPAVQITFRNLKPSQAVAARIRSEVAKLGQYYDRITSCRVVVEVPHRHRQRGDLFLLRIDLHVPGDQIAVNRAPSLHGPLAHTDTGKWAKHLERVAPHKDIYVTIRDAFNVARRRLEDYARRLRGDVKMHARVLPFRPDQLCAERSANV